MSCSIITISARSKISNHNLKNTYITITITELNSNYAQIPCSIVWILSKNTQLITFNIQLLGCNTVQCGVGSNADYQRAKGTLPFTAVRPYPRLRPKIGLVWGYWDFVPLARLHDMHSVLNQNYKDLFGVI